LGHFWRFHNGGVVGGVVDLENAEQAEEEFQVEVQKWFGAGTRDSTQLGRSQNSHDRPFGNLIVLSQPEHNEPISDHGLTMLHGEINQIPTPTIRGV
jgi:hypothetical protein